MKVSICWFRRDLRLHDNRAFFEALQSGHPVVPLFIFDSNILDVLPADDARVAFIHESLSRLHQKLNKAGSSFLTFHSTPEKAWDELMAKYDIAGVYTNHDYEPYAIQRDQSVKAQLEQAGVSFHTFKDQVIFEKNDITKADGKPYTVYTPYKNKWLEHFSATKDTASYESEQLLNHCIQQSFDFPSLTDLGFEGSSIKVPDFAEENIEKYDEYRDIPHLDHTTHLGTHLRFGTVSIRQIVQQAHQTNAVFLSELIWREFFMSILYHFPHVVDRSFKAKYDNIRWENDEQQFARWCEGNTGYPMVDAGMRQLNQTGYMHNRVRMVVASFLCKHLLIDWRWGEAYFAEKLLDYELAANNGNWQWAAGCGCDAAPYFRVFNPTTQLKKFDPKLQYTKRWVPEYESLHYTQPIVEHATARTRAIDRYKEGLNG